MASEAPAAAPISRLTIANLSDVADADFDAAVAAIGIQVLQHFQPVWGVGAALSPVRLSLDAGGHANVDGATDAVIYLGNATADPTSGCDGAFGYHAQTYGSLPYAFVYLDACRARSEPWSVTLSHEVMELLVDPTTAITVSGPAPGGPAGETAGELVRYDLEVCDPTQGDTYDVNGVTVSNFVTKAWFGLEAGGPTNHLGLPIAPFEVRPGGYIQYETTAGAQVLNGAAVSPQAMSARTLLGAYRRNARRVLAREKQA